jgi:chromosome segregation ATPase
MSRTLEKQATATRAEISKLEERVAHAQKRREIIAEQVSALRRDRAEALTADKPTDSLDKQITDARLSLEKAEDEILGLETVLAVKRNALGKVETEQTAEAIAEARREWDAAVETYHQAAQNFASIIRMLHEKALAVRRFETRGLRYGAAGLLLSAGMREGCFESIPRIVATKDALDAMAPGEAAFWHREWWMREKSK